MSAIFGLVHLDGRSVPPERMETMRRALDGWGPDGMDSRIKGCAGLGHAHLCTTPEAHYEQMPWKATDSGILVTAAARLDNRDDLCNFFHIPLHERPTFPDGRLVALSFERFGEDAPARLFGDWSFAAWNEKRRRLFVARDHLGNTGLFYCHKPPFFAFASTPKAILALPEFPAILDEWQLARYLAIFPSDEDEWSRTFWKDIHLLLPAHCLTVTPQALQLRKYWRIDDIPAIRLASDEEYLEGFRAHFRRAVQVRLRCDRPVGSTLSAGLDSGSVTALAAEALQSTGQTLTAFTSVPRYPAAHLVAGALADEWPLAHTIAEKYSNIQHVPIGATDISPLKAVLDRLDMFGHPLHAAANFYWMWAINEEARRHGIGVILTGQLGNGGISWSGGSNRIFYLLAQHRWGVGMNALRAYRENQGCSWYRTFRRHLVAPILGPLWRRRRWLTHPTEAAWGEYSAIHPEFARRLGLADAMRKQNHDHDPVFARPRSPEWERRRTIELNAPLCYIHHHSGAAFQMDVRDPTADIRLLEFCFGVPEEQHSCAGGERMLVRRSLGGILPEEMRWNVIRGKQAADVGRRLLDYRDEMEEELKLLESHAAVAVYLDCRALRKAWQSLSAEITPRTNQQAASLLLRGIMAGHFVMNLTT
jgi:asparagine synthase (glutamine-hydrolysing)